MADMNLSMLIRLIDQVSEPARRLRDNLAKVATDVRSGFADAITQGFSVERVEAAFQRSTEKYNQARRDMLGAFAQGLALAAPVLNMGKFESQIVGFGNTAGIFGDDLKAIEQEIRATAPLVNKSASELLTGLEYLVGKGPSPDQALAAIKSVGMTATATGSSIEHMSASGFAALDNLKVPADQLQLAFDAMAQSGKSGGFELAAMAQYFSRVSASAMTLKMQGVSAVAELGAALQIASKGTGDDSTAAGNLKNFIDKLSAEDVRKNFAGFGVSIEEEFAKADAAGASRFEHIIGVIEQLTADGKVSINNLFGDQQALDFLRIMLPNLEEYRRIRDEALSADGVNQDDFGRVMGTFTEQVKAAIVQIDNLASNSGVLLGVAKQLVGQFTQAVSAMNEFAQANPELTRVIVMTIAGLTALSIATKVAAFAFWGAVRPIHWLANTFLKFDSAGKNVAQGWQFLARAGGVLGAGLKLVSAAAGAVVTGLGAISAPVWLVVGILVAAGFALWKYWDRISSFVSGMAEALGGLLSPALDAVKGAIDGLLSKIGELFGLDQGQIDAFKESVQAGIAAALNVGPLIDGAKELLGGFWTWLTGFFSQETLSDDDKAGMKDAGRKLIEDMWAGIQEQFGLVLEWFKTIPAQVMSILPTIDLGSMIKWPEPPEWLSWVAELMGWKASDAGWVQDGETKVRNPDAPTAEPGSFAHMGSVLGAPPSATGADQQPESPQWSPAPPNAIGAAASQLPVLQSPVPAAPPWLNSVPPEIQQTIHSEVIDKRPPHVTVNVTQNIQGPNANPSAIARALAHEIDQAKQGALHDGIS